MLTWRTNRFTHALGSALTGALLFACTGDTASEKNASTAQALNPSPQPANFAIYAQRSVTLGAFAHLSGGDVGVAAPTAAGFGTQLTVGQHADVEKSNLISPSVTLGSKAHVGDVQTTTLTNDGATLGAVGPFPAAQMPPLPFAAIASPSGSDVTVAPRSLARLTPGAYGALTIGDFSVVTLGAGTYTFASVSIGDYAAVFGDRAGVTVQVAGSFASNGFDIIVPEGGAAASALTFLVGGGDVGSQPAASVGEQTVMSAVIIAPHGTAKLADHVDFLGAVAGFDVATSDYTQIAYQSGLPAATHGQQQLSGYVTPPIAAATIVGPVPPSTPIHLAIGLPVQDPAGMAALVQQVSDPTSPTFRHYLDEPTFETTFSPTTGNYQQLVTWAQSVGLTVTEQYENRLLLDVAGTAEQIESAFYTNLVYHLRPDGSQFFSVDQEPSLQLTTLDPVLRISGLDNRVLATTAGATGPGGSYATNDVRTAYASCTSANGSGQSVGLFELDGFLGSDVTAYECQTGIGTCNNGVITAGTVPNVQVVTVDNFSGAPSSNAVQVAEVTADTELVISMAPGLGNVYVFEASNDGSTATTNDVLDKMLSQAGVNQYSSSWFIGTDDNTQPILYAMALQNRTFFQAVGDQGSSSWSGDPGDIHDLDAVTFVGGTSLTMGGTPNAYQSETTWNVNGQGASGGGTLSNTTIPFYQSSVSMSTNSGSTTNRNLPDVSMVASNLYFVQNGSGTCNPVTGKCNYLFFAGTSAGAPLWAGYTALANQLAATAGTTPVGFVNPFLYAVGEATAAIYNYNFNDINDGSNNAGSCTNGPTNAGICQNNSWVPAATGGFSAVTGYDLTTGWGTPRCPLLNGLATGVIAGPPPPPPDAGTDAGSGPPSSGCGGPLSIAAEATEGGRGCEICITGQGFTPGGIVQITYLDAPVLGGSNLSSSTVPTVASDCSMGSQDPIFGGGPSSMYGFNGNGISCTAAEASRMLTIQATDVSTGKVATTTIPEGFVCGTEPMTGTGTATCPLPPE